MERIKLIIFKNFRDINSWRKRNPKEFWFLIIILAVAAFCRLYKIGEYMTFLGDEGRDVIIVRRIFTELHPPLIGPGTSIGNMYLGPLYYYMMAPALFLAGFSPIGPAIQIAVLGIITVLFVWKVGREWFGKEAAIISAFIYSISPTVIIYSRSSWNPNIMPFFSLLTMYSIWKVWKDKAFGWLIVLGVSFAFVLQSHYLGLLLLPTIFIYYFLTFLKIKGSVLQKTFFKDSLIGLLFFLILMSPLFFFDLRHNWMNARAMYMFFTQRQTTVSAKPWSAIPKIPEMLNLINTSLVGAKNIMAATLSTIVIGLLVIWILSKKVKNKSPYIFLVFWIAFGLLGLGLYKQAIYDHYFGFVFVVPYLLVGAFLGLLFSYGKFMKLFAVLFAGYLVIINLLQNPLRFAPNNQLQRSQDVAKLILSQDMGKPFNLAVLAERNYEDGYGYFLELWGGKVLHADRWDVSTIANQLFIICEMEEKKCDPTHSPKAEVANFGMSKIDTKWSLDGVIIYRLLHIK